MIFYIFILYIFLFSLFLAFEYYRWSAAGRSPAARCSAATGVLSPKAFMEGRPIPGAAAQAQAAPPPEAAPKDKKANKEKEKGQHQSHLAYPENPHHLQRQRPFEFLSYRYQDWQVLSLWT